jgi:predicted AlkP superfamily phosphohydrolase/phosphomutase
LKVTGKKKKVVVLGIDGVSYTLLHRLAGNGLMPNAGRLIKEGTLCKMTASLPEVSSTSWTTFATGVNPGKHGIYGFMEVDRRTYSWRFPNTTDLKARTIWEIATEYGKRSIVINVPSTYPAKPFNGMLVAGFVALDLRKASYPDEMYRYLSSIGYKLDVDARKAVHSPTEFSDDLIGTFRKRIEAIEHLYDSEEWDLFIATVTETDRLHHYFWDALSDTTHPQHDCFMRFYSELDAFIGSLHGRSGDEVPFFMISDHGFTVIKKEIYLNTFLREKGYLKFTKEKPESLAHMDEASLAFALDPSRIYIHLEDKYARGKVRKGSYDEIRRGLKQDLLSLKVEGESVISKVFLKEDIYNGTCFDDAPDLVVLPYEGFDLKGAIAKKELYGRSVLTGGHTRNNAVFYINRKVNCGDIHIADAGVSVLQMLGVENIGLDGVALV